MTTNAYREHCKFNKVSFQKKYLVNITVPIEIESHHYSDKEVYCFVFYISV